MFLKQEIDLMGSCYIVGHMHSQSRKKACTSKETGSSGGIVPICCDEIGPMIFLRIIGKANHDDMRSPVRTPLQLQVVAISAFICRFLLFEVFLHHGS